MKPQILRTNITSRLYNPLNGPAVSGRTWRHSLSPESKHFYCQMTTNTHGVQMVIFRMLLCFFHPVFIRPYPLPHCIFFFHSPLNPTLTYVFLRVHVFISSLQ